MVIMLQGIAFLIPFFTSLNLFAADPVKFALIGDTSTGRGFTSVLQLIKAERADVIMINGDLGYGSEPSVWRNKLKQIIDVNQSAVIGSLGNHDVERNNTQKYIDIFAGFRNSRNGLGSLCTGGRTMATGRDIAAADEVCTFGNVTVIASAIGQMFTKPYFEGRLGSKLRAVPAGHWTLVGYHFTLSSMNPGLKSDQASQPFFELIRAHGAIGAQAHTHSVMASCPIASEFKAGVTPQCAPGFDPNSTIRQIGKGIGLFLDSSIGGQLPRPRTRCKNPAEPKCTHMVDLITKEGYTHVSGRARADFEQWGAMFVTFNYAGDPSRALVNFKSTDGQTIFEFEVRR